MEQMECDLCEQAARLNTREDYSVGAAMRRVHRIVEHSQIKRPCLSIGNRQSLVARIARVEDLKDSVRGRFVHAGAGYSVGLRWRAIDTAFESRILIGAVINLKHIEPRQFFKAAREIVVKSRSCAKRYAGT